MGSGGASYQSAIATNRFGLGARPQDQPGAAPQSWVLGGIAAYRPRPPAIDALEPSDALARRFFEPQPLFRQRRQSMAPDAPGPTPPSAPGEHERTRVSQGHSASDRIPSRARRILKQK